MTETGLILAVVGFILGSIQYYIRTRLQDIKEDILRIMRYYDSRGESGSLSLSESMYRMRDRLKIPNLPAQEKKEYGNCIQGYDNMMLLMRFSGIYVPLLALLTYFFCKSK